MKDKRLENAVVVASVSGGKDSAAMSLYLTEQGIEHRRVFADTGWEAAETYDYLRGPLEQKLGRIHPIRRVGARIRRRLARSGASVRPSPRRTPMVTSWPTT